ncbi:MAG TPA: hypothetical protein EYG85_10390 [Crocinitomix sp.]|nr:hypothetical protein [Crocinitomix sp.]
MKLFYFTFTSIIFIVVLTLPSCLKHKTAKVNSFDSTCVDTISFNNEIMPEILTPSCNTSGCHNSTSVAGGYDLSNYTNNSSNADIILNSIQQVNGFVPMPLGAPKLDDSLINKFKCWIEQGKLNN